MFAYFRYPNWKGYKGGHITFHRGSSTEGNKLTPGINPLFAITIILYQTNEFV